MWSFGQCVGFLRLPEHTNTHWGVYNNRNVFSPSSEGRNSKSRQVSARRGSLCRLQRGGLRRLFQLLVAVGNAWSSLACRGSTPVSTSVVTCCHVVFSLYVFVSVSKVSTFRTTGHWIRAPVWLHLNLITSAKTLIPIRSDSQVPGVRTWTYLLKGYNSSYISQFESRIIAS